MDVGVLYLRLFRKGVWRYLRIGGRKAEQVSRPFRFLWYVPVGRLGEIKYVKKYGFSYLS